MGFYINEETKVTLNWRDIACITIAFHEHLLRHEKIIDPEIKQRMNNLVNMLGREMYDCPDNDKPNSH